MRKVVFTMVGVLGFTVVFAQQEELKSAAANIESKNYIAALDNISKAKKKVNDLMTAQLASVLPQKFGEYEMAKDSDMGYGMEGQGVTMNKVYRKPKPKVEGSENGDDMMDMGMGMPMGNEEEIRVQVTTNMMMANEVQMAHSMSEQDMGMGGMEGQKTEALRIKGYRAMVKTFSNQPDPAMQGMEGAEQPKREEAHAIVGGAFIMINTQGLEDGKAKAFLEQVDFEKLVGIVGK